MQNSIQIHPKDTVGVALAPLKSGQPILVGAQKITLLQDIPQGHKFALCDMPCGEEVIKYGSPIGKAREFIPKGAWVHTHNIQTGLDGLLSYSYRRQISRLPPSEERFFQGYRRKNGKAGIRNEIWILPTVGCVNSIASRIEKESQELVAGNIDGILAFPHPYGCSQLGDDQEHTRQILADLVNHPNAGGVLVLGLGCENTNIEELKKYIGPYDPQRVRFLVCQEWEDEFAQAQKIIRQLAEYANRCHREPIRCRELVIGLKCGGSDGLSGITANPVVGAFSDLLLAKGGTTILTEVPEMFGAETLLMNRCENEALFHKAVAMIDSFKNYFISHHQVIYENPSPGNKQGGISTLEEKSLGCIQKSGSAPITGVLSYGEPVSKNGLHLLSAPGNDLVASTALAASGAQIVLFTTGRGTPFACPVPTVKISTNSALYRKKRNWMDFDCGTMVEGVPLHELAVQLLEKVLLVASGEKVRAEINGFHDMAIFKQGVTL